MSDVPIRQRSIYCGLCKEGRHITIPRRYGRNSRVFKHTRGRNRDRKRAVNFIYRDGKLIPVCKECGFGQKLIAMPDKWDEYVVQSMMGI